MSHTSVIAGVDGALPPHRYTQEEITEVITHMAFYAGWPAAMSAAQVAYTVLVEGDKGS